MSPNQLDSIKITGVITEEIGVPTNDGTRGSALYDVPFQLSATPPMGWAELLERNWDNPPRFTSMHRPGILSVVGDRVVLDGTTMEEVEKYHLETLKLVIQKTNQEMTELIATENQHKKREDEMIEQHKSDVQDIADRLEFD